MKFSLITLALIILLFGCNNTKKNNQVQFWYTEGKTMGTYYRVLVANQEKRSLYNLSNLIEQQLYQDSQQISIWKNNTIISRFNHYYGTKPKTIPEGIANIVAIAMRVGKKTNYAMDITIGPLVNLWGFGPDKQLSTDISYTKIKNTCKKIGLQKLQLIETSEGRWLRKKNPSLYIDLSTLGEGYVVDHLTSLLKKNKITSYLVSVGGAVATNGLSPKRNPWLIAVQNPESSFPSPIAIIDLHGYAISTSGNYHNYRNFKGNKISHIINPKTCKPVHNDLISATVIATSALEADAWDTSLMVLGSDQSKKLAIKEKLAVFLIIKNDYGKFVTWMSPQFRSFIVS